MISTADKLLPVCVDGKYGYINPRGDIVVSCQNDYASEFSDGLATIRQRFNHDNYDHQEIIVIDADIREIGRLVCGYCGDFSDGLMWFERNEKRGYVDRSLQVVIPPSFDNANAFVDGLAWANVRVPRPSEPGFMDQPEGIINRSGQWVIRPQYARVWSFRTGERVTGFTPDYKLWGLIDRQGVVLVGPRFAHVCLTSKGLTPASIRTGHGKDTKYGFINESGDWVVTPRFDNCYGEFSNDTLGAAVGDRWGIVNREGAWIIEPRFTVAESFHEGLSRVYVGGSYKGGDLRDGKWGYIDGDGEFVVEPIFDEAWPFKEGVAEVELAEGDPEEPGNYKSGYIDMQGRYIWEPTK